MQHASKATSRMIFRVSTLLISAFSLSVHFMPSVAEEVSVNTSLTNAHRVNCGGPAYTTPSGIRFEEDQEFSPEKGWGYVEGSMGNANKGASIKDTDSPDLFLTDRWGVKEYRFQVQPGIYTVTFYFAEVYFKDKASRVFDVLINGQEQISGLDIFKQAGFEKALLISRTVNVSDGWIVISVRELADKAKFSAIAIEPATADKTPPPAPATIQGYPRRDSVGLEWKPVEADDLQGYFVQRALTGTGTFVRLNAQPLRDPYYVDHGLEDKGFYIYKVSAVDYFGNESELSAPFKIRVRAQDASELSFGINVGGAEFTDATGRRFLSDHAYNPANGAGYVRPGSAISTPSSNTEEPFRSMRQGRMVYRFDLPSDAYQVTLGFIDPFSRESLERTFSVFLNEFRMLDQFDIMAQYGNRFPAEVQRTFRAGTNGLEITFHPQYGQPLLSFIHVQPAAADAKPPAAPVITRQIARDEIVFLEWTPSPEQDVIGYQILRAEKGSSQFQPAGWAGIPSFVDRTVSNGQVYAYQVVAYDASLNTSAPSQTVHAEPRFPSDEELLDIISRAAFEYFAQECDPRTFLTRDKNVAKVISTASTGFGLTALCVGVERGWMSREEAERRVYLALRALNHQPSNKADGMFFHYLKGDGSRSSGGYEDVTSTVDTALLAWGALAAGEYFGGRVHNEASLLVNRMNWKAYINKDREMIAMAYCPARKSFDGLWDYYTDEALLVTLLGIGAVNPDHRIPPKFFYTFLRERKKYKGITDIVCTWPGALFTYTFAHCWIDFKTLGPDNPAALGMPAELQADWWSNSVKAIQANKIFCEFMAKRFQTFGTNAWGLTASSGPGGRYTVAGAPPCGGGADTGEGTLALYGAGMSVPFLPEDALAALKHYYTFRDEHGNKLLWKDEFDGGYGLIDAYNLDKNWFSDEIHGINHGPMLLLIENHRSGLIWKLMLKNEFVRTALKRVGYALPSP